MDFKMSKKKKKLHNRVNKDELKKAMLESDVKRTTLSFYKYVAIEDPKVFRDDLYLLFDELGVMGRIYVATEGLNAQLSVPEENFEKFKSQLYSIPFLDGVRLNIAIEDDGKSFFKLVIKVRPQIVADGLDDDSFDPSNKGIHLDASSFNELTSDPNTIVVDMRNHYESEVGHFKNAITPDVETFKESLPIINDLLEKQKEKNIVMYCTGGIRCEKASAYLKHQGFENVFQLNGGIIEYVRQVRKQGLENKFIGKNFVFDERLGEKITEEPISVCHQCGNPSDRHTNCANDPCHILFIQCEACAEKMTGTCSIKCKDFLALPLEEREARKKDEVFNGTKFGKGRYKAHRKDHELE